MIWRRGSIRLLGALGTTAVVVLAGCTQSISATSSEYQGTVEGSDLLRGAASAKCG